MESLGQIVSAYRNKLVSFGRLMWKGNPEEAKKPVPYWFHFQLQIVAASALLFWYWKPPVPNKAVLCLAAIAALMVLAEMRPVHKAIYFILIIALVFTENRAIDKDRDAFVRDERQARKEENEQFQDIANELRNSMEISRQQFAQTMERSDRIIAGVGDTIKTETGGDSFAYITFTPQPNQQFMLAITSHGKYPLRQVHVTMMDEERRLQAMQEYNKHPEGNWIAAINAADTEFQLPYLRPQSPEAPGGDVQMLGAYAFGAQDAKNLTIAFSSLNGYWNERLHLRRINGKWHQSLSVMGPTAKQALHPFIYSDPDYPEGKALAEKDWAPIKRRPGSSQ